MSKTKIPTEVLSGLAQVDTIDFINHGGCGIVAYAIVKKLFELGSLKVEDDWAICFLHGDGYNLKRNQVALKPSSKKVPGSCNHIAVRIGDIWVDSEGIYKNPWDISGYHHDRVVETKSPSKLLLALNHSGWNTMFDRYGDLNMIEKYLDVDLSEIYSEWEELDYI